MASSASATSFAVAVRRVVTLTAVAAAVLYAGYHLYADLSYVANDYLIDDDCRQHLSAFVARNHPDAFRDRLIVNYAHAYQPLGYRWLMSGLSAASDPVTASKLLGFGLLLTAIVLAAMVGRQLAGALGAAACTALVCSTDLYLDHVYAGLYRSFALPLLLLQFYFLLRRQFSGAAVAIVLQALFYPLVCFITAPVTAAAIGPRVIRRISWLWKEGRIVSVSMAATIVILVAFSTKGESYGSPIDLEQASLMCEWHEMGRVRELPFPSLPEALLDEWTHVIEPGRTRSGTETPHLYTAWPSVGLNLSLAALLLIAARKNRYPCLLAVGVAGTGILLHVLARTFAFSLGFPVRYLQYALPFLLILVWPMAWGAVKDGRNRRLVTLTLVLGAIVVACYPWKPPTHEHTTDDASSDIPLFDALSGLEPYTFFTAWPPHILDDVPLFVNREVLVNTENAHPIYLPYYRQVRERLLDTIQITFSTNAGEVAALRDKYGLTHLILRHANFFPKRKSGDVFRPITYVGSVMRRRTEFRRMVFGWPKLEWVVYSDDTYAVFDLRRIKAEPLTKEPAPDDPAVLFPDDIALIGVDTSCPEIAPGQTCSLRFDWEAPAYTMTRPLTVHAALEREGKALFDDSHLLFEMMDRSKLTWHARKPVPFHYEREFSIPADTPPGRYQLRVRLINNRNSHEIAPIAGPGTAEILIR